jgi:hypothetical protein
MDGPRSGAKAAPKMRDPHQDRTATLQLSPEMIMSLVNGMDIDLGMISGVYDPADAEQLKQKAKVREGFACEEMICMLRCGGVVCM